MLHVGNQAEGSRDALILLLLNVLYSLAFLLQGCVCGEDVRSVELEGQRVFPGWQSSGSVN